MKKCKQILTPLLAIALTGILVAPSSAFLWFGGSDTPTVADCSKNVIIGETLTFTAQDFPVVGGSQSDLQSLTVKTLPDGGAGALVVGSELVLTGTVLTAADLNQLRFQTMPSTTLEEISFSCLPTFTDGSQGTEMTITIRLLQQANEPPIAKNITLTTYRNVNVNCFFDAVDSEGDLLTFQMTSTPARGGVTMSEDGSSQFVYTPYENKTGKDSFSYVAIDPAGNISKEATVTIQIDKPSTAVVYSDMDGDSAHKAAVRLAEEGIYVGRQINGAYFFDPDQPVTRNEFLSLAMATAQLEPLDDVSVTGFYDDEAIPTWAKGYVSSALMAGAISGTTDDWGKPVFDGDTIVTQAEAAVIINHLLNVSDVVVDSSGHWADQATANLATAGVISTQSTDSFALATQMTMGDVAELLDGALEVMDSRENSGWLLW